MSGSREGGGWGCEEGRQGGAHKGWEGVCGEEGEAKIFFVRGRISHQVGKSGELPEKSGTLPWNFWIALKVHNDRTVSNATLGDATLVF